MERTVPKECTTNVIRPKKKYLNYVGQVYKNVINGLMGSLEEEFRVAGCSSQTLRLISDTWIEKVIASKAVDNFLSPDQRRRGSLSAAERAEAVAKRDMAVAQERMAYSKFLLVGDDPKTKPAITSEGTIVQVPCNKEENDMGKNSLEIAGIGKWTFPPDSGNLDPNHVVLVSLKIPLRTNNPREERSRVFKLRLPALFIQQKKLDSILNKQLVKQLSELPVSAANACIQNHLRSIMLSAKYPPRPMSLSKQLDGNPGYNSDECVEYSETGRFLKDFFEKDKDCDSASSSSIDDDDQEDNDADKDQNYQPKNEKLSRKSKQYLKKLFYLCDDSSSESSSDEASDQSSVTDNDDDDESDNDECEKNKNEDKDKDKDTDKDKDKEKDTDKDMDVNVNKLLTESINKRKSSVHNIMTNNKESDTITSDDKSFMDLPNKKLKMDTAACQTSKLDHSKITELNNSEGDINEIFGNDDETEDYPDHEPLNSDDDLESLGSSDEPEDFCVCLFNVVKRTKKNWRIELGSGIMNISGEDYAFNSANVTSKW